MQGQLGDKLVPDLIREIAQKNLSGLLRLTRGKAIKAIFFEAGAPTFAISNLTNEQLEHKLVIESLATAEQIALAKSRAGKAHRLGPTLVEMGMLEDAQMRKLVCDQVMGIILSLFEWTQGDYTFDERIRAAHDVTLGLRAAEILLEGARHAADIQQVADALVPPDAVVLKAKASAARADTGRLIPLESYILSRIESPTAVTEVGALSGLGDADARRAVCALVAAGFLKLLDREEDDPSDPEGEEALDRLREEVIRKLQLCDSSDFYDVLSVTWHATPGEIKAAYYQLAKKYHPDRYHQRDSSDLRNKLETLFALITQAYETLSQPTVRLKYDERIRKSTGSLAKGPSKAPPDSRVEPETHARDEERTPSGDLIASNGQLNSGPLPAAAVEPPAADGVPFARNSGQQLPPAQLAERYYQQGRARFERKEYHAAVHLLREAIKLDPGRAPYHYHLGIALIRNPRTRRDAEQHLAKAAELEPYNAQIRVKLGLLYKEAGLTKRADHYFREALQLDPDNRVAQREIVSAGVKSKAANESIWKADVGTIAKRIFKK